MVKKTLEPIYKYIDGNIVIIDFLDEVLISDKKSKDNGKEKSDNGD